MTNRDDFAYWILYINHRLSSYAHFTLDNGFTAHSSRFSCYVIFREAHIDKDDEKHFFITCILGSSTSEYTASIRLQSQALHINKNM